ncbi:MAG: NAD(P)/FAD-dependent oxidoreductase [Planctomycetaceae bacterium]|nr:NAD(P)/FAD-dependent oxidoreductase [Planctomycetaceae bacterium]
MQKIIIIGSGPSAWTAAIYSGRAQLNPIVFTGAMSAENQAKNILPMGQLSMTTEIENFPGFPPTGEVGRLLATAITPDRIMMLPPHDEGQHGISGPELVELMRAQAVACGANVIEDDIVDVDFTGTAGAVRKLTSGSGKVYETQTVIVATGARANWLGLDSETKFKNRGVSACAVCDGALPRFRNKEIAVIGGGDSAVEEANYLAKFASKVYLIHRRDKLRASRAMEKRALEHPKIEILWNRVPTEVLGDDKTGVAGLILKSTLGYPDLELPVVGMFVAIGHTPNSHFLKGKLNIDEKGFVIKPIPFRTNTSVEGVFTAGDVADSHYRQAITAAATGAMSAIDAERYLASLE